MIKVFHLSLERIHMSKKKERKERQKKKEKEIFFPHLMTAHFVALVGVS